MTTWYPSSNEFLSIQNEFNNVAFSFKDKEDFVEYLIAKGGDVNAVTDDGETPLDMLDIYGNQLTMQWNFSLEELDWLKLLVIFNRPKKSRRTAEKIRSSLQTYGKVFWINYGDYFGNMTSRLDLVKRVGKKLLAEKSIRGKTCVCFFLENTAPKIASISYTNTSIHFILNIKNAKSNRLFYLSKKFICGLICVKFF